VAPIGRGELLGLRWQDADLDEGFLEVRRALVAAKGGPAFVEPKTAKGKRRVRLTPVAVEALKRHKAAQNEERLLLGGLWRDDALVFPSQIGTPMDPNNLVNRSFKLLLKRAGLPQIRFQDLRHTFATLMLKGGEHPKIVQEILGHANISITLDTYSHVLPDMQDGAVSRLGTMLSRR
jgi:integrase